MMAVASLLLAQAASALVPRPASATPHSVTVPLYDVTCEMSDLDGREFGITIRQTGGRGYSQAAVRPGAMGVNWTRIEATVTRDSSNRYSGVKMSSVGSDVRWPGVRQGQSNLGRTGTVQFQSFETTEEGKVVLLIQPEWPLGSISAFGLCSVQETPQEPLSDSEAAEYVAQ